MTSEENDETGTEMAGLSSYGEVEEVDANGSLPPPASTSGAYSAPSRPKYLGGFSTSICDLFRYPMRRTDCCALACCGVLASDRTRYLLTEERPSWCRRVCINILPVLLIFAIVVTATSADSEDEAAEESLSFVLAVSVALLVYIAILTIRASRIRFRMRQDLIERLYRLRMERAGVEVDAVALARYIKRLEPHTRRAQFLCCCGHGHDRVDGFDDDEDNAEFEEDLCGCIWKALSCLCWSYFYGSWFQLFGMCAIGQEEREVNRIVPSEKQAIDYVTFQPHDEYYPGIMDLRRTKNGSIIAHIRQTSKLSWKLVSVLFFSIVFVSLFALSDIDSKFTFENLLILLLTFGQAFLILHFTHWRWNRFTLSLDAVIKYFACGFLLTPFLAITVGQGLSMMIGIVMVFVMTVAVTEDMADGIVITPRDIATHHPLIFLLYYFVTSFIVAALVEELCKYFGFWMVEHPDLKVASQSRGSDRRTGQEAIFSTEADNRTPDNGSNRPTQNLNTTGTAITIAMVACSLGFACSENLIYVFLVAPPSVGAEFSTLLLRSIFPIHPLAAAIQSIGVCRRDLEGDSWFKLGQIVFPSLVFHGGFDFIMMAMVYFKFVNDPDAGDDDVALVDDDMILSDQYMANLKSQIPALAAGMVVLVIALVYYIFASTAQKARLAFLDEGRGTTSRSVGGSRVV